ncbi:MAG: hypothetical protein IJ079_11440, partial [Lachnospiraceae bacterium]|nr:hypothetical protein [Lachnospiraceae bacterium]
TYGVNQDQLLVCSASLYYPLPYRHLLIIYGEYTIIIMSAFDNFSLINFIRYYIISQAYIFFFKKIPQEESGHPPKCGEIIACPAIEKAHTGNRFFAMSAPR